MKNRILTICLVFISAMTFGQTKKYKISSKEQEIGSLVMNKTSVEGDRHIDVTSKIKVKIVVTVDLQYKLKSIFKNGVLDYCSVIIYVNNHVHSTSITENKGDHYLLTVNGDETKKVVKINFSEAMMYLTEPIGHQWVYSEIDDVMKSIKSLGNHVYEITNPKNGHKSTYYYIDGVLDRIEVPDSIIPFYMELI